MIRYQAKSGKVDNLVDETNVHALFYIIIMCVLSSKSYLQLTSSESHSLSQSSSLSTLKLNQIKQNI